MPRKVRMQKWMPDKPAASYLIDRLLESYGIACTMRLSSNKTGYMVESIDELRPDFVAEMMNFSTGFRVGYELALDLFIKSASQCLEDLRRSRT